MANRLRKPGRSVYSSQEFYLLMPQITPVAPRLTVGTKWTKLFLEGTNADI